jgi:hypothetical protein
MRQWLQIAVVLALVLWMVGCTESSTPVPGQKSGGAATQAQPSSPPPAAPAAAPAAPAAPTAPIAPAAEATPAGKEATPSPPATPAPPAAPAPSMPSSPLPTASTPSIRLYTGVALPQTGPEGTMMGFSLDYQFEQGEPSPEGYVWVIERAHGQPAKQQVKLSRQGNLATFVQGWRPEDGPFHTHIEDHKGNRVSESIELH